VLLDSYFVTDPSPAESYTLSLHDALPILTESQFRPLRKEIQMIFQDPFASLNPRHTVGRIISDGPVASGQPRAQAEARARELLEDRKSTRLNSSHVKTSYAVLRFNNKRRK